MGKLAGELCARRKTATRKTHDARLVRFDQVRTLFVSGLPMDAKPRELYLLFRAYDGYENSQLKVTSKNGKTTSVHFTRFSRRCP